MDVLERGPQLAQLSTLLAAARRGTGHVALVTGEAGIGKSILVETFCRDAERVARVVRGACDPVVPARPFAPLTDVGASLDSYLQEALVAGARERVFDVFLAALRAPGRPPRVIVFEDLHWADDATLDLLRVVGRRIRDLPVLLIGTYRDEEVDATHPLHLALGDVPSRNVTTIGVPPLSVAGVAALAEGTGRDPTLLHDATAGNAFFVTEVLASGQTGLPATIRDAVAARAARLSQAAQEVLSAAAVLGFRSEMDVVQALARRGPDAIEQCVARGVLRREGDLVSFRHELARVALLDAMPSTQRIARHRRAMDILRARSSDDAARLVTHADGANDRGSVLELAPIAAARAAALGAHREAASHYATALRHADGEGAADRARLLAAYARELSLTGNVGAAIEIQERAIALWRSLGDPVREGDGLLALATMNYLAGSGERALELARQSVAILESIPEAGRALAMAYAVLAQRLAVAGAYGADELSVEIGERALRLAEQLGDDEIAVHAQTTIGIAQVYTADERGWATLEASAERAQAAGLGEAAARALINLVEAARDMRRFDAADRYAIAARTVVRDYDLYHRILRGRLAELAFDRGRWDAAVEEATALIDESGTATVLRVRALTLIGRCRARRGESGAWSALDAALAASSPIEVQELAPLHAARAEASWIVGDMQRAGTEALTGLELAMRPSDREAPWWWGELAFWAWRAGVIKELPAGAPDPYNLHASGRPLEAAVRWAEIGAPYQEALALADCDAEADLLQGLRIAQRLGARPLERMVTAKLRGGGATQLPRGPRGSTRRNPAGLTDREVEVVRLLARRMRNAEIAEQLVVSPKTVDHHVSSILRKLGVPNRNMAVDEATRLGLQHGASGPPT